MYDVHTEAEAATMCHENKQGHRMKDMTKLSVTPRIVFSVEANLICLIPLQVSRENCPLGYSSTYIQVQRYSQFNTL